MGPRVLVRPPGPELRDCQLTFQDRAPIDTERATEQHAALVEALTSAGAAVEALPRRPEHPDAPFVEDTAVVLPEVVVFNQPPMRD